MTDREAFEAWFAEKSDTGYVQRVKSIALWAWQAAIAHERSNAPAWKDAPDAPGLWVVGSRCLHINELDLPIYERSNCRWFGPVPDDGGKP